MMIYLKDTSAVHLAACSKSLQLGDGKQNRNAGMTIENWNEDLLCRYISWCFFWLALVTHCVYSCLGVCVCLSEECYKYFLYVIVHVKASCLFYECKYFCQLHQI